MFVRKLDPKVLFLCFILFSAFFSAYFKLPLIWDGAGYAVFNLAAGKATVLHDRFSIAFIQAPTIFSAKLESLPFSLWVFNFTYSIIPFLALFFTYLILRRNQREDLFLIPALHIVTGTIWMQHFYVSEALITVQIFWILLAGILIRIFRFFEIIILSFFLIFLHPIAIPLFFLLGIAIAVRDRQRWLAASFFIAISIGRSLIIRTNYETSLLSLGEVSKQLSLALNPPIIIGLITVIFIGLFLRLRRNLILPIICILGATLFWSLETTYWNHSFEFRSLLLPISIIFYAFFFKFLTSEEKIPAFQYYPICGLLFVVVLGIQGYEWKKFQEIVAASLEASETCCASLSDQSFQHWGNDYLGILLQDTNTPKKLFLNGGCMGDPNNYLVGDTALPKLWKHKELLNLENLCR